MIKKRYEFARLLILSKEVEGETLEEVEKKAEDIWDNEPMENFEWVEGYYEEEKDKMDRKRRNKND